MIIKWHILKIITQGCDTHFFGDGGSYATKKLMPTILSITIQYFTLGMSVKIIEKYLGIKEQKFCVDTWVVGEPLTYQTHQICLVSNR